MPIALRSSRQRLLFALVVARLGQAVPTDELIEALWGNDEALPVRPSAALQSQVHRLRRQLGPVGASLTTEGPGYRFACAPEQVDAVRFEALVARARAHRSEPTVALAHFDAALGLWRGRAYLDLAEHDAVRVEAMRLEELRADAMEERAELLLTAGRAADAAAAAEQVAAEHPYRERPVAIRMQALVREGRQVEALRTYDTFRRRLGDELGAEPSPELRAQEGKILRHETRPPPAIGLPGNSFVGREVDLAEVTALLERGRLVTLTGPGGIGKTRLATHAAARTVDRFPDGIYLCELASVTDAPAVAGAVASTLLVEEAGGGSLLQRVVEVLQAKRALLLLDNCEHVLVGVRELTRAILARAPEMIVLATSRQRLGVEGEHVFVVRSLPVPTGDDLGPASVLFTDRATAAGAARELSDDDLVAVRELCRRLEGLPLAIELAAARSVSYTPGELLVEVADRVDRLADTRRAIDRHRSIDATLDWSYGLLDPREQEVFRRVSVFAGGCTAQAAAAVLDGETRDTAQVLGSLVEHSLVSVGTSAGRTRFSMLEPVRQYAEARLAEEGALDRTRARHAAWAVDWMEHADTGLRGADEGRWAAAIDAELPNLRAAHRWCCDHDPGAAVRLVASLFWYGFYYAPSELFTWADTTVERFGESGHPRLAGANATAALGACRRGDLVRARALAERGIDLAGDPGVARFLWEALRSIEFVSADYEQALVCGDRAVNLARAVGDSVHEAHLRALDALSLGYLGRLDDAGAELSAAESLLARSDNPTGRALCDYVAGEIRIDISPTEALPLLQASRDAAHRLGNRFIAGIAGVSAASCTARVGDPADALGGYAQVIDHLHRVGAWPHLWTTIRTFIETLTRLGDDEPAAVLHGALVASPTARPVTGADATRMADVLAALRDRLGDERVARLETEGAALGDERAIAFALRSTRSERHATTSGQG